MKFSKEKEQSIIQDYLNGKNTVEIAKKWNTYNTSIRRVLKRNNIPIRTCHDVQKTIENPFTLGEEFSEYFLGLLLTDGTITNSKSPEIKLGLKDNQMIEKFKSFLKTNNKIQDTFDKRFNTHLYTIGVRSLETAKWLKTYGQFENKSFACDIFTEITPAILRGIFDGDGYWHITNKGNTISWGICGASLIFLEKIKNYLYSHNIVSYIKKDKRKILYYLEVYKTIDILRIANIMYQGASIYLQRKYDKWHLFEETLREKCVKFKEGDTPANPEPSLSKRFGKEGAETIIRYLNTHTITSA